MCKDGALSHCKSRQLQNRASCKIVWGIPTGCKVLQYHHWHRKGHHKGLDLSLIWSILSSTTSQRPDRVNELIFFNYHYSDEHSKKRWGLEEDLLERLFSMLRLPVKWAMSSTSTKGGWGERGKWGKSLISQTLFFWVQKRWGKWGQAKYTRYREGGVGRKMNVHQCTSLWALTRLWQWILILLCFCGLAISPGKWRAAGERHPKVTQRRCPAEPQITPAANSMAKRVGARRYPKQNSLPFPQTTYLLRPQDINELLAL